MISKSNYTNTAPAALSPIIPQNVQNFHEIWKVPFVECRRLFKSELSVSRTQKAVGALIDLFQVVCGETTGAISKSLSHTIKSTAYAENMYIAYLLSLVACQFNGMDFQHEAEVLHRRALCIGIRCVGSSNPLLANSMEWLAFSLYRQGNNKEALLLCTNALALIQSSLGSDHPDTGNCYLNLSAVLESLGVKQHAIDIHRKGETIMVGAFCRKHQSLIKSMCGGKAQCEKKTDCYTKTTGSRQNKKETVIKYRESSFGIHSLAFF